MNSRKILVAFFVMLSSVCSTKIFAIGSLVVTGSILRNGVGGFFDVTITVPSVENENLLEGETDFKLNRIKLYLNSISTTEALPFTASSITTSMWAYAEPVDFSKNEDGSGKHTLVFKYRVRSSPSSRLQEEVNKGSIKVKVQYFEKNVKVGDDAVDQVIPVINAVVSAAPGGFNIEASDRSLGANWDGQSEVTFSNGQKYNADSVTFVVVTPRALLTDDLIYLPSRIFTESANTDPEGGSTDCALNPNFNNGEACVTCTSPNAYLDTDKLKGLTDIGIFTADRRSITEKSLVVSKLANGVEYAAFMYFEPGGLNRSACFRATPEANLNLAEQEGGTSEFDNPRCFIATAAFGSPLSESVGHLVWFREHVLAKHSIGRSFIKWYYFEGPAMAQYIEDKPVLKFFVRVALWPLVLVASWMQS